MRPFSIAVTVLVLIVCTATLSVAWEFALKGEMEWRFRYWTRTGDCDIFGQVDSNTVSLGINQLATFPTSASSNRGSGSFGVLAGENRFGSDMNLNDLKMTVYPKIKVNKALEVSASINLTSLGIWSDGQPLDSSGNTNPGYVNTLYVPIGDRPVASHVPNSYVTLQWLKLNFKTPLLDFSLGYKSTFFGMGLWRHEANRSSTSFGVSAKWGPFKFSFGPYFSRARSAWALGSDRSRNQGNHAIQRKDDRWDYFRAVFGDIEYTNGPFVFRFMSNSYHQPSSSVPEARGGLPNPTARPNGDILRYRLASAAKYFDGTVFFNAEVDWFNRWSSGRGSADSSGRVTCGGDNNAWMYGVELGALLGPAKVTANYVRATGDDPSTRKTTEDGISSQDGISSAYMKHWGYLMYFMYGAGDGWDAAGWGQPTNFHHLGLRMDYAVASNLNTFLVFSHAWRDQPNAYRYGGDYQLGLYVWTNDDILNAQAGTGTGRAVPDHAGNIGWECDAGFSWKLLESLTWSTTLGYWQPGNWWSYALPNTANIVRQGVAPNTNPNNPAGEARAAANPDRRIDPLVAVETTLLVTF